MDIDFLSSGTVLFVGGFFSFLIGCADSLNEIKFNTSSYRMTGLIMILLSLVTISADKELEAELLGSLSLLFLVILVVFDISIRYKKESQKN